MKIYKNIPVFLLLTGFCFFSSFSNKEIKDSETGKIVINFVHHINGKPVIYDSLFYRNMAGNKYEINQVQYFISEVVLHKTTGENVLLSPENPWHYLDKDFPESLTWNIADDVLHGDYDSISFTFGFSKENNKSYMFRNPPESYMFWPDVLGGGYHYMKINLKYIDKNENLSNFNCHLGRGRLKNSEGKTADFIDNCFTVAFSLSSFKVGSEETKKLQIIMNIDKWFDEPNKMDFSNYHGIMDDQDAMKMFCENGVHVFTVNSVN